MKKSIATLREQNPKRFGTIDLYDIACGLLKRKNYIQCNTILNIDLLGEYNFIQSEIKSSIA